jgi:hypothetical protein
VLRRLRFQTPSLLKSRLISLPPLRREVRTPLRSYAGGSPNVNVRSFSWEYAGDLNHRFGNFIGFLQNYNGHNANGFSEGVLLNQLTITYTFGHILGVLIINFV